ncbi:hypothetical protein MJM45_31925, partial [Salmonella enterica subsp. enterica serovar Kentucky]|nr:hypothetical protein [Salmonella enterica subsp. enterica serovar Kentucky]
GATPLFTTDELRSAHVAMALYPLSAFRAMNRAAEKVYTVLRQRVDIHTFHCLKYLGIFVCKLVRGMDC